MDKDCNETPNHEDQFEINEVHGLKPKFMQSRGPFIYLTLCFGKNLDQERSRRRVKTVFKN
ncbi:hypothetical protein RYX56_24540, partial [Alkalihalophilus lindianensis]